MVQKSGNKLNLNLNLRDWNNIYGDFFGFWQGFGLIRYFNINSKKPHRTQFTIIDTKYF